MMDIRGRKQTRHKHLATPAQDAASLLLLPEEILQLVLRMLGREELHALLGSSKAMAQLVMKQRAGRLQLRVAAKPGRNWAPTRHLLQWAPPACMKLQLQGPGGVHDPQPQLQRRGTEVLCGLMGKAASQQQFVCLMEVSLQGFVLPCFVPPGLPDTCPNVHTLHLHGCYVTLSSFSSSSTTNTNTNTTPQQVAALPIAPSITHLKLTATNVGQLDVLRMGKGRVTRQQLRASSLTEELRATLPNLSSIHVSYHGWQSSLDFIRLWASQLTGLHLSGDRDDLQQTIFSTATAQLQQLQKLSLPGLTIRRSHQLCTILALPQLKDLELEGIILCDTEDLSNHPCSWQRLHIRCDTFTLSLSQLAGVPLHSLAQPVVLGNASHGRVEVQLPRPNLPQQLAKLEHLASKMMKCGVELQAETITYSAHPVVGLDQAAHDAHLAASLSVISPLFHAAKQVRLWQLAVGQQVLGVLHSTHQQDMKVLHLGYCEFDYRSQSFWDTLLSSLPLLGTMKLCGFPRSVLPNEGLVYKTALVCRRLISAMAQQPEGRHINFALEARTIALLPLDIDRLVLQDVQPVPTGVEVNTAYHEANDSFVMSITCTAK